MCDQTTNTTSQINGGKVKAFGVTSKARVPSLPAVPTLDEQGIKGFEVVVWHGIYAPKGTPKVALERFNAALRAALKDPVVAQRLAELGGQIVPESKQTPASLHDWLAAESAHEAARAAE